MAGSEQVSIIEADQEMAINLLEVCRGNHDMEDQGGGGSRGVGNGGGEDDVRAPIPQKQEMMVAQSHNT